MNAKEFFKNKKVLVVILGIYGGGAATAKWIFKQGAQVTVTDMRTEKELEDSMKLFTPKEKKEIRFVLGGQREEDFVSHDIIVLGAGVPRESPHLLAAQKAGKQIENDASLFFRFAKNPVIAVTGTRGKSTTTSWLAYLLSQKYGEFIPTGNNPEHAFLKELISLKDEKRPVVAEMSSWQLEHLVVSGVAPHVAVITNLFPDHLNRYKGGMEDYGSAKANIFKDQTENDFLILNAENEWTKFFLLQKPKAHIFYFSKKPLAKNKNGMFIQNGVMVFRNERKEKEIFDVKKFTETMGEHNLENLLATVLAVTLFDLKFCVTKKMTETLPQIPFRQEIIFSKRGLTVVNDSAGTSPDATVAILRRFSKQTPLLITGGTDKDLEFSELAKEIKKTLTPARLFLLNGSATKKLIAELKKINFFKDKKILLFENLSGCVDFAFGALSKEKGTVLFSPGGSSFEKFKNEFQRGKEFNLLFDNRNK